MLKKGSLPPRRHIVKKRWMRRHEKLWSRRPHGEGRYWPAHMLADADHRHMANRAYAYVVDGFYRSAFTVSREVCRRYVAYEDFRQPGPTGLRCRRLAHAALVYLRTRRFQQAEATLRELRLAQYAQRKERAITPPVFL